MRTLLCVICTTEEQFEVLIEAAMAGPRSYPTGGVAFLCAVVEPLPSGDLRWHTWQDFRTETEARSYVWQHIPVNTTVKHITFEEMMK